MNKQTTSNVENSDLFTPLFKGIAKFYKQNKQSIWVVGAVVLVTAVISIAACEHHKQQLEKAWGAYYKAQMTFALQGEEAGMKALDQVSADYADMAAGQYAQLFKGDLLYSNENFAQAAEAYRPLLKAENETVRTLAALSLAAALQSTKDYQGAIDLMNEFIQHNSKSFALPQAYLTLALSQELSGNKTAALETYKLLQENYANVYFGSFAKDKITQLNK